MSTCDTHIVRKMALNGINGSSGPSRSNGLAGIFDQQPKVTMRELNRERANFILEGVDMR